MFEIILVSSRGFFYHVTLYALLGWVAMTVLDVMWITRCIGAMVLYFCTMVQRTKLLKALSPYNPPKRSLHYVIFPQLAKFPSDVTLTATGKGVAYAEVRNME